MRTLTTLIISTVALGGCSPAPADQPELRRFEFVREKMGGSFKLVLYAQDQSSADRAASAGYARVDQLNAVPSDYAPPTKISRLSQRTLEGPMPEPVHASDDLWRVLERAADIAKQTGGA